jgi:hypothetical protein
MHDYQSFYVTLPSDSSLDQFPQNTASSFTTKLKHPLILKGRWEVALVELQYLNSIFTVLEDTSFRVVMCTAINNEALGKVTVCGENWIRVPAGNYQRAEDLLDIIREQIPVLPPVLPDSGWAGKLLQAEKHLPPNTKAFTIGFVSDHDHRVVVEMPSIRVHLVFNTESAYHLRRILGFGEGDFIWRKDVDDATIFKERFHPGNQLKPERRIAGKPMNTILGVQSIFIYCDVADYSLVGDTSAQVLRNVAIRGGKNQVVTEKFEAPHYTPVLPSHFETIHVLLANDLGDAVKFAVGKTIVKLHFRPARLY